tara:strand:- start:5583 stop:7925 length:2343 start_codon:yes stop_codon:yes gene_type:complete
MKSDPATQFALERQRDELVARLPTRAPIYLPTSKIEIEDQVSGLRRVLDIYTHGLSDLYKDRMLALREQYRGTKRAFIVGNGPSLNETDLTLLKDEVTFCVNGFFLKMPELGWAPTFYLVEDHLVAEDRAEAINALKGPTKLFPAYLGYCIDPGEDVIFFNHLPRKSYPHGFDFTSDASSVTYTGCTVTFTAMQLAHWLGFEELYLIGVDASYSIPSDTATSGQYGVGVLDMASDDPNHFHPDYFGKGFRWHDPQVDKMLEAYAEAKRATEAAGRPILNATVGGELEVFRRVDYNALFPAENAPRLFPRLAVIDMTAPGDGTATGNVKSDLLRDWPAGSLLSISSLGTRDLELHYHPRDEAALSARTKSDADALLAVEAFDPDLVLYRPLPEKPAINALAHRLIEGDRPFAVWMMDDWPARLEATNPAEATRWDATLRDLFDRASLRLSISDAMSSAFEARYGQNFLAVANGIDPAKWPEPAERDSHEILVRYSGGLAADMSLESLLNLARAIEALAAEHPIRLEINTREHWMREAGSKFDAFQHTSLASNTLPAAEYRAWLSQADIVVIAYDFGAQTQTYTQYSRANKLPECLASGAATLAIGPVGLATIDELIGMGHGTIVTQAGVAPIEAALRALVEEPLARRERASEARKYALEHLTLQRQQDRLNHALESAASIGPAGRAPVGTGDLAPYLIPKPRSSARLVNLRARMLDFGRRSLRFYLGWKGALAMASIAATALPALFPDNDLARFGPALGIAFAILLFGQVAITILAALERR